MLIVNTKPSNTCIGILFCFACFILLAFTAGAQDINAPFDVATAFISSGYMGDVENVTMKRIVGNKQRIKGANNPYTMVSYRPGPKKHAGVYWQSPADNWGDKPGHRIKGASKIVFWAAGEKGGEIVEFKAGGIRNSGKRFQDSFEVSSGPVTLTKEWKKFEISLKSQNLSSVLGGFAWVATTDDNPSGLTFYLDSIRYQ
jgi:hypothetical protein